MREPKTDEWCAKWWLPRRTYVRKLGEDTEEFRTSIKVYGTLWQWNIWPTKKWSLFTGHWSRFDAQTSPLCLVHSLAPLLVEHESQAATTTNIWTLWGGYRMGTRHKGKHYLWPPLANTVVWTILILDAGSLVVLLINCNARQYIGDGSWKDVTLTLINT